MSVLEAELIKHVGKLKPAERRSGQSLHRPLLMLWAVGQAVQGAERQHRWSTVRDTVGPLLTRYAGVSDGTQHMHYPFWALQRNHLWEISDSQDLQLTSAGRRPTVTALNTTDPLAGLPEAYHELLSRDPGLAAHVAGSVILRFFDPLPPGLLDAVGLNELLSGRIDTSLRPRVGEPYANRSQIMDSYGGNGVMGITPLKDGILSVFSDEKGPYDDSRIPDTNYVAYTGDGLSGDQVMKKGNKSLQNYQEEKRALRYWHRPHDGHWTFETWAVVVQLRRRWGLGEDKVPRREFVWVLAPVDSPLRDTWSDEIRTALAADDGRVHDDTEIVPAPQEVEPLTDRERYRRLTAAAHRTSASRTSRSTTAQVERFYRSRAAREAVLLRSLAQCENPGCLGHPTERTDAGAPLLEVDHVNDLARDGADTPETMIALCPNCHALKTRGSNRRQLRPILLTTARERHERFTRSAL